MNGSQLNAANLAITAVDESVGALTNQINNGTVGLVQQDATTKTITVARAKDGKRVSLCRHRG